MEEQTKKLRNEIERSITCIENLSYEIFYEIFDYLDGFDIYNSFSNLNYRFLQLINSSSLLLKIKLDYSNMQEMIKHKQIDILNKNQIISIYFLTEDGIKIIPSFDINSFNYLQSLVLLTIKPKMLCSLLSKLTGLPNFFSLTIDAYYTLNELNNIYRLIFSLPKLRYLKFAADEYEDSKITVSLLSAINEQFSTIEYLVINHPCTFKELFAILSYTPQVRRLKFDYFSDNDSSLEMISPITLSNLTHISMYLYTFYMTFDKLELFITKINCKLRILRVDGLSEDMTYLDAVRWEKLILKYLPQLEKFYLEYHVDYEYDYKSPTFYGKSDQFKSPFWIERRWVFDAAIEAYSIIYAIHRYKERWYDYGQDKMINSSDHLSKSMQFYCSTDLSEEYMDFLPISIRHVLNVAEIYHLYIYLGIFIGRLDEMLLSLCKLESLQIDSLLLLQPNGLSIREEDVLSFISQHNSITKVYIEKINDIEELYCLMKICPRMTYLKVKHINNIDIESFVRLLATKMMSKPNHHLKLLCFCAALADDKMVQQLEKTINSEKLFFDCMIKRVRDNIYLQWK